MANFFNSVRITNFKSLKDVTLSDCKRINLLIGKPNVGKSNILEAMGLFGLGYSVLNKSKKLTQFTRFENTRELFFDGNVEEPITIAINNDGTERSCRIDYQDSIQKNLTNTIRLFDKELIVSILNKGAHAKLTVNSELDIDVTEASVIDLCNVKQYKFALNPVLEKWLSIPYLIPPYGSNLLYVIQEHKQLRKELSGIFSEYGLKLVIDTGNHRLRIQKDIKDGLVFSIPYDSIADTLQRIIFFKAAIASNQDSILLFEEPEAHCFPPYIAHFTQDVIDSETNQFFIATHSPYVLNDFLEDTKINLAIYMVDFQDGQTVVYRLSDEELDEIYTYGIDVFFNYERFTAHG